MKVGNIKVTTTPGFDDVKILEYYEPVTSHIVIGMNVFKDFFSGVTDFIGGKSESYQKTLESINIQVINELRKKARSKGANCVLGLKIDNDEISAQGKSMMMVTAIGTPALADFPKEQSDRLKQLKFSRLRNEIQYLTKDKVNSNSITRVLKLKYNVTGVEYNIEIDDLIRKRKKMIQKMEIENLENEIEVLKVFEVNSESFLNDLKSKLVNFDTGDRKLIDDAIEKRQKHFESIKSKEIEFEFMKNEGKLKKSFNSLNDRVKEDEIIIWLKKTNELKIIKKVKHELNKELHLSSVYIVLIKNLKFNS